MSKAMSPKKFQELFFHDEFKLSEAQERVFAAIDCSKGKDKTVIVSSFRDRGGIIHLNFFENEYRKRNGAEARSAITRRLLREARTNSSAIEFKATSSRRREHLYKLRGLIEKGKITFKNLC